MTCPICESERETLLFSVPREELPGSPSYDIYQCRDCAFWSARGPLNGEILSAVYGKAFHASSQQSSQDPERSPIVVNARKRAARLREVRNPGKLLDVGAGKGYFVQAAAQYFDASGIEYSADAASYGRNLGLDVLTGDFLTHDFGNQRFDIVTMWDVLACFDNPHRVIDKIYSLLKPGGLYIATVPYSSSWVPRLLKKSWPLMIPPINMSFFSTQSLQILFGRHEMKVQKIATEGKSISLDFLARKFLQSAGISSLEGAIPGWTSNVNLYLNLGDIATIYSTS